MTMDIGEEVQVTQVPASKKASQRRASANGKQRKPANLACLNCRPRKIKCQRVDGSCERCRSLNLQCKIPDRDERKLRYSKEYIEGLESEIAELKQALEQSRAHGGQPISPTQRSSISSASLEQNGPIISAVKAGTPPDSLIQRLTGIKRRVNSHSDGQDRYFGPTSSLHLTETPSSISNYSSNLANSDIDIEQSIPEPLQQHALDMYWTFQHNVLPVVHKEAFLNGMETGRGPYFSRCLFLCLLASGARISSNPEIRNLSIPGDENDACDRRPLMKQAEDALEKEITNPSITTIQCLLLLSVLYCIQSNDSKGWMLSGNACRLVFDLGLHQDWTYLSTTKLSQIDVEMRQVVFWGCFNLDRLWALYLGRPPFIKLIDVSIRRPDLRARTWDLRIFAAWVHLLDTAGQIGDKLNTNSCSQGQIDSYSEALQQWYNSLDPSLHFDPAANTAVYHLHLQYSAMTILVNRHNCGYADKKYTSETIRSRQLCLHHASRIAQMLEDYRIQHGDSSTMIGSALYNVTMAATVLVAEVSESRKDAQSEEMKYLMTCLRTMKEMEHTEIVAKNVFNIVQTIMRVCNVHSLDSELVSTYGASPSNMRLESPQPSQVPFDVNGPVSLNQTTLAMWPAFDFEGIDMGEAFPFAFEQPVVTNEEPGMLPPMDAYM